jgi:hypothetical protein
VRALISAPDFRTKRPMLCFGFCSAVRSEPARNENENELTNQGTLVGVFVFVFARALGPALVLSDREATVFLISARHPDILERLM